MLQKAAEQKTAERLQQRSYKKAECKEEYCSNIHQNKDDTVWAYL